MKKHIAMLFAFMVIAYTRAQVPFIPNVEGYNVITNSSNGGPNVATQEGFGISISPIGDLNNDGVEDIVVGAHNDDDGGSTSLNYGAVYICFMDTNKTVKSSARIGRMTTGFTGQLASGDNFGRSVCGIGDLNGDGNEDIAVGAYQSDLTSYSNSGAVYIIFLDSTGAVSGFKKIARNVNGGPSTIRPASFFGAAVVSIGDINRDGVSDIAVGGNTHDEIAGGNEHGAVWILKMKNDGTVKSNTIISNSVGWSVVLDSQDGFGAALACNGDLNGDRIGDLLVSASGDDDYFSSAGALYLLYLDTSGTAPTYKKYTQNFFNQINYYNAASTFGTALYIDDLNGDGQPEFMVTAQGETSFYIFSTDEDENIISIKKYMPAIDVHWSSALTSGINTYAIASLGDIDMDDKVELVFGAFGYDLPATNNGAIFVLDMEETVAEVSSGDVLSFGKYGELSNAIAVLDTNDFFGTSVCELGDVNGDGFNDIAIGAMGDNTGGNDRGAVYIVFLDSLQHKVGVQKIASGTGGFGTGLDNGDFFGVSVTAPGDLDGDDIPDLVAGAHLDDDGGTDRGCIWVIYLNANGTVKGKHKISDTRGGFGGVLDNSDQFGVSVAAVGDINNDGVNDLCVGANRDDDNGTDRGAVWILFMNTTDSTAGEQKISDLAGNFTETFSGNSVLFGRSVTGPGDMNGDGLEDIIVGAPAMSSTGRVYVIYLDTTGKATGFKNIGNNFPASLQSAKRFGESVTTLSDIDGNGYREIVIGNILYTTFSQDRGAVWVAFPDSLYNILTAKLINEETPYFNGTIRPGDQFGYSVCTFTAADSSEALFIGANRALENSTQEGAVFSIKPAPSTSKWLNPAENYVVLHRALDAGVYTASGNFLMVEFDEEYFDTNGKLNYAIYGASHNKVLPITIMSLSLLSYTSHVGDNRLKLNISLLPAGQHYVLEVSNQKNEVVKLRFKK